MGKPSIWLRESGQDACFRVQLRVPHCEKRPFPHPPGGTIVHIVFEVNPGNPVPHCEERHEPHPPGGTIVRVLPPEVSMAMVATDSAATGEDSGKGVSTLPVFDHTESCI